MSISSRHHEIYLGSIALQWISYLNSRRISCADQLLASDCIFAGFELDSHSTVYLPIRALQLPRLITRRLFAAEDEVALHFNLAHPGLATGLYRIFFRFRFAKISQVHFSALVDLTPSALDTSQFELRIPELIFELG